MKLTDGREVPDCSGEWVSLGVSCWETKVGESERRSDVWIEGEGEFSLPL